MTQLRVCVLSDRPELIEQALDLVDSEWPKEAHLREERRKSMNTSSSSPHHLLPANKTNDKVVAHLKLASTFVSNEAAPCAMLFSLVVDRARRGCGIGKRFLENAIRSRLTTTSTTSIGVVPYLYLDCKPELGQFYEACGFRRCAQAGATLGKVVTSSKIENFTENSVAKLENMLGAQLLRQRMLKGGGGADAIQGPLQAAGRADSPEVVSRPLLHFRRRLRHSWPLEQDVFTRKSVAREMTLSSDIIKADDSPIEFCYFLDNFPHQRQIGPSCGMVALNMAAAWLLSSASAGGTTKTIDERNENVAQRVAESDHDLDSVKEMFEYAANEKNRLSDDGELFSCEAMQQLVSNCEFAKGLEAEIVGMNEDELTKVLGVCASFGTGTSESDLLVASAPASGNVEEGDAILLDTEFESAASSGNRLSAPLDETTHVAPENGFVVGGEVLTAEEREKVSQLRSQIADLLPQLSQSGVANYVVSTAASSSSSSAGADHRLSEGAEADRLRECDLQHTLIRFLQARNFDVAKTKKMLESHVERWNPHEFTVDDYIRYICFFTQHSIAVTQQSLFGTRGREDEDAGKRYPFCRGLVVIFDMRGWSLWMAKYVNYIRHLIACVQDQSPQLLARCYLANTPRIFQVVWKVF
eukprot:g991.t1